MISLKRFAVVVAVALGFFYGCSSTQGISSSDGEEWVGEVSGMAYGDLDF